MSNIDGVDPKGRPFTISSNEPPTAGSASEIGRKLRVDELQVGQVVVLRKGNTAFSCNVYDVHSSIGVLFATPRSQVSGILLFRGPNGILVDDTGTEIAVHEFRGAA